jgi:hypothetical protein
VAAALHEGLLLNAPQADVVRFSPALTVSKGNIDEMLLRLARAFARLHAQQQACREVPARPANEFNEPSRVMRIALACFIWPGAFFLPVEPWRAASL